MALPALLGGVAGVVFSDFIGGRVLNAQGYGGPLATVAWGYALQSYGGSKMLRDAGTAIVGVGAGLAFSTWRAKSAMMAPAQVPAGKQTAGYLGEPIMFDDRMDPYMRKVANIGLP